MRALHYIFLLIVLLLIVCPIQAFYQRHKPTPTQKIQRLLAVIKTGALKTSDTVAIKNLLQYSGTHTVLQWDTNGTMKEIMLFAPLSQLQDIRSYLEKTMHYIGPDNLSNRYYVQDSMEVRLGYAQKYGLAITVSRQLHDKEHIPSHSGNINEMQAARVIDPLPASLPELPGKTKSKKTPHVH